MMTEKEYVRIISQEHRKKYAQFFTPKQISDFMASWILEGKKGNVDVLEPAFGLGAFSKSMYEINSQIRVVGYDADKIIYSYAKDIFSGAEYKVRLINDNYLTASWSEKYDGIICNPPYLKFHDYDNTTLVPVVNNKLSANLSGFTNIYTLFLLKSISQMKEGGRLAYIVPSEFLNSDYGVEVKRFLLQSGVLRHVIIIDFTQCAFDDALTTACILLCENDDNANNIYFSKIDDVTKLSSSMTINSVVSYCQLNPDIKWKQYYEVTQSSKYNHLVPFSTFAKVSRGIATGANDYFTFRLSKIDSYNIPIDCFCPCICHAIDVQKPIFTEADFVNISNDDKTVYLFDGCADENDFFVQNYIRFGEKIGVDKKYLTKSRKPWYALENRKPSPIWASVFNRNGLRFIRNKAGVYNLTTFHCVYNVGEIDTDVLFAYLLTDVAKEILLDNSRQYGNGLVKFEPNDLNKGNVVDLRLLTEEEKLFVLKVLEKVQCYSGILNQAVSILNIFFKEKYTCGIVDLHFYADRLEELFVENNVLKVERMSHVRVKQLNLYNLFEQYDDKPIIENYVVGENLLSEYANSSSKYIDFDEKKNVLVSLVKRDNEAMFLDRSAKIYYTGKKFPSTVALNNLFYFMPYIKGKGIRDLWLIKTARIGCRKEGSQEENKNDLRLVFEVEFIKQLFDDYKDVELKIWRTFTDSTLNEINRV